MPLIFEDSKKITKKQIPIPQKSKNVFKAMKKIYKPFLDKNIPGSKILKSLGSDKKYNKKGVNSNINGEPIKQDSVNVNDAKVRLHRMNKLPKNSLQYQLNGGELAANIYKDGIARARSQEKVSKVEPPKPTSKAVKPTKMKMPKVLPPNGKIKTENRKIYISEAQIHSILESRKNKWAYTHFRKQEDIDNNLKLLLEYPYYYVHFLSKWRLIDDWDEEPYSTLYDLCDNVFASIEDGDEKSIIDNEKKEIYDIIVNDEYLSALSYRYIEDYIKPLIYKQDIVDRYAQGESLKNVDWTQPRNSFDIVNSYGKLKTYLKR